ncbi:MAG: FHA domain-containing protein [Planctomycetota bacterium]|nr:FHA domain-containing protein [Planctomycetota bacterium]
MSQPAHIACLIEIGRSPRHILFLLETPGLYYLGRDPACNMVLNDPRVEPRHVMIQFDGLRAQMINRGAPGSVSIESIPKESTVLENGQILRIGGSVLSYRCKPS